MKLDIRIVTAGALLSLLSEVLCQGIFDTQPRILTQNGHLLLISGRDRNITLKTSDRGYVNLNGENLVQIAKSAREAAQLVSNFRTNVMKELEDDIENLRTSLPAYQLRLANVEKAVGNRSTATTGPLNKRINGLARRVGILERRARQLQNLLTANECASNPCQNGGTCIDTYNGFFCLCPKNWEGSLCNIDVNECSHFAGTDLGCQNGATCINRPGTYECVCASNWLGVHCTQRSDDCSSSSSEELCGHGTCINTKSTGGRGYKCLCEQGWTTHATTGACTVDVDECSSTSRPACSVSPAVQCINVPGSFFCGPCPQGYTGNGYYCTDIDECQVNNGGCSVNPLVQCINTLGSRLCGQCPPGYQGDGKFCTYIGVCSVNNGGCHPMARCVENPRIGQSYVECICPTGYVGSGMGPAGCVPGSGGSGAVVPGGQTGTNPCIGVQCVHGSCLATSATTYRCVCLPGYAGLLCDQTEDPCIRRPCQNGGSCIRDSASGYHCTCTAGYTGFNCQEQEQSCGGTRIGLTGVIQFPESGSSEYGHNLNCPWLIITNTTKVIQVTFTKFQLESSPQCEYDFLQIHDGKTSGSHMLGRYCGNTMPPNITSTHNKLYLWFRSDQSRARGGFTLIWNSTDPVCGSPRLNFTSHGLLTSPGSPGKYPNNRDCFWTIEAPYGRRIQFTFSILQIEASANCSNDYLEIYSGSYERGQVLNRYCNTSHPRPLTTPGHIAVIYFHTNDKKNDAGFQIHYTSVESFPGCGGILSQPTGEIISPNHPNTYRANVICDWHIQLPQNERIHLTFLSFSVENSPSCLYDSVEIRGGVEEDSPVIGRYCGTNIPPPYTSTRNELVVRFTADYSGSGEGFRIRYESLCGGIFSEATGVLTSPYYPNSYPESRTCIYEIALEPGQAVELCFQDFEVEDTFAPPCRYDYLQIRDGHNENATLIGTYCGGQDQFPTPCITSQYNHLWMKFKTDSSIQNKGFYANYSSINVQCGGILKENTGVIQSPNYPLSYPHDHKCRWVIVGRPGTVVQLTWQTFSLEGGSYMRTCRFDKVMVFDNSTVPGHGGLMGTFCGDTLPPVLTTTDNTMTIIFTTDYSASREGFSATYSTLDASTLCGAPYFTTKGHLQSPNYPSWYPHNKDCTYTITVPTGQQIRLNVTDFELEGGSQCYYDYLEIRNGGTNLSPLIGKYCGTSIPRSIPSLSHQLYLRFKTDGSGRGRGFRITWDGTATGCGGILTASSGSIMSPNYPQSYGHSSECFWKISVNQGSAIQLVFVDLELEGTSCYFDYLEVYDGRDTSARKIGRYCSTAPLSIVSTYNNLYIKFRADTSIEGRGFHIRYETICNRIVKGYSGVIESPNFPQNYPDSLDCTWNITAPRGNKINVTFSHFSLEPVSYYWWDDEDTEARCIHDYIEIKEGRGSSAPDTLLMEKKCGTDMPQRIHSSKDHVYVHFVTDENRGASGFRLEWVVDGCGGVLRKPKGTFSSPNYPRGYPVDTECEWRIFVDWNHSIEVTIKNFSMENVQNCYFDSLTLYSGTDDSGPMLHQFCHTNTEEEVFTSSGSSLFVKFTSDGSFQGKGFTASYQQVPIRCGGKFTSSSGTIHSPNYPQNYEMNEDCKWLIEVDKNHVIWLQFLDFDLNYSPDCDTNFVKVYDGNKTTNSTLLFHDCSNNLPSVSNFTSTGNQLLIHLRTDDMATAKGFRANYSIACGARIVARDTGIISTSTSMNKEHNKNCSWIIIAENPEDHVTLTINLLDIARNSYDDDDDPCPYYFIEVRDGQDADAPLMGRYCGNRAPPHLTTQGSAMFVHAVSNYYASHDNGFSATYSVISTVCGGNLSSEHGSFASPGYPNSYPPESGCEWFITTSPGNRVMLTFSMFELETSDYCNEDYVEVRKDNGIGHLIGVYCGNDIPSNLTAETVLWVKFRSTGTGTARGFVAEYSLLHGNDLSGPSGQIASPLYPLRYMHDGQFYWRITVENSKAISITLHDFFMDSYSSECYYSYLAIYDGYDETGPLLSKNCGPDMPDSVISSSNVVYIEMSSSGYRTGSYFLLSWLQVERQISSVTPESVSPPIPGCGGLISMEVGGNHTAETYTLTSPGYPEGYGDFLNCEWIFETTPVHHLSIYFQDMNLEQRGWCYFDYVEIYTGEEGKPNWKLLNTVCLPNATYQRPIETSNLMKVVFKTDSYYNKTGFKALVKMECGGSVTGPNGVIDMRNESRALHWMSRYSPLQCEWNVTVRNGKTITVDFSNFNIPSQDGNHCAESNIVLRNGISRNSPMLGQGRYCGRNPGTQFETTGNHLRISFKGLTPDAVFKLSYAEKAMACGGQFSLTSENTSIVISSPNYPNIPQPHTECEWVFMAPAGERIHLDFLERFDITYSLECRQAFVELRDGGTIGSELIDKFCEEKPSSQYTTGNMLYVRYYTDVTDPKNGFKANVSIDMCGGTLRARQGLIRLPTYPGEYPSNLNCSWRIEGPPDHFLTIWFDELSMPNSWNCTGRDSVTVSEMQNQNVTVLESYWGWGGRIRPFPRFSPFRSRMFLPRHLSSFMRNRTVQVLKDVPLVTYCETRQGMTPPINSSMNEVNVRFQSYQRESRFGGPKRGFSLRYNVSQETCGGVIEGSEGIFQSPGYPSTVGYMRYCRWDIIVPVGHRVKVELLDFDMEKSMEPYRHRLIFYDSMSYYLMLKMFSGRDTPEIVRSSSNKMRVIFISYHNVGHRGFKARYSSDEIALCGGDLNANSGFLSPPAKSLNLTEYTCEWERTLPPEPNKTFVITMVNGTFGMPFHRPCFYRPNMVAVMIKNERYPPIIDFCGNYTAPETVALPFMDIVIGAVRGYYTADIDFTIRYSVSDCGGILSGPLDIVSSPMGANGKYPSSTSCAWIVKYPEGSVVNVTFVRMKLHSNCDGDYLLIRNGPRLNSPLLNKFCGSNIPQPVISQTSNLWIAFHSDQSDEDEGFTLRLEPVFEGCGGVLQTKGSVLQTPKFPGSYPSNSECLWDIRASDGYSISLKFIERFEIETSAGCVNDFVEVFDYVNGEYKSKGRYCDRTNHPLTVNSTGSQMRVLFRSNENVNGGGFKAVVDFLCGGIITEFTGRIVSPGFPLQYDQNLKCNYTIIPSSQQTVQLEFVDFELEGGLQCYFDWVTIYEQNPWYTEMEKTGTYCGTNTPPPIRTRNKVLISFRTDSSVQRRGFMINFASDDCGGNVTSPGIIHSPTFMGRYYSDARCRWNITAPAGKVITLRFSVLSLEYSGTCMFDYVAVYDGSETNNTLKLATLCGEMQTSLPVFHSTGNKMVVVFRSDYSGHYQGFRASVTFAAACGGTVQVDNAVTLQPTTTSDPFISCRWLLLSSRDKQIQLSLTSYTPVQCNTTTANNCSCSYIEIRDGPSSFSELIKRYCGGETLPLPLITSSANQMFVSFVSESGIGRGNFQATISAVTSLCGSSILNVTSAIQELTSPGYPSNYPPNIRCRWILMNSEYTRIDLHFSELDIESSTDCTEDFLSVEENAQPNNLRISEGVGNDIIYSGRSQSSYHSLFSAARFAEGKTTYCGSRLPLDYYTEHQSNVLLTFKSNNAVQRKGFKLRYTLSGCKRNYTSIQGRIYVDRFEGDCIITVQVPANRTIALYFLRFSVYSNDQQCGDASLEVRDGMTQNSPLLAQLCGYERPNSIFSTGNVLRLHKSGGTDYGLFDITYTSTDQGRGCGGVLFNYGGIFTSPFYPNNYRNNTVCRWDVTVPAGRQPVIQFSVFDIGARTTCETDFVELYDINLETNEETFIARYCGEDNPALHEGSTGTISVRYTTSVHNGGTGWVAIFVGKIPGRQLTWSGYW